MPDTDQLSLLGANQLQHTSDGSTPATFWGTVTSIKLTDCALPSCALKKTDSAWRTQSTLLRALGQCCRLTVLNWLMARADSSTAVDPSCSIDAVLADGGSSNRILRIAGLANPEVLATSHRITPSSSAHSGPTTQSTGGSAPSHSVWSLLLYRAVSSARSLLSTSAAGTSRVHPSGSLS